MDCYNARRRALHGGALRDCERIDKTISDVVNNIEACQLIGEYISGSHIYLKLVYKGFNWDIRKSNFLTGNRPWTRYSHKEFQKGCFIYRFDDINGHPLYIGKSRKLPRRLSQHFSPSEIKLHRQYWKKDVTKVFVCKCKTEADMHFLEMYLINTIKPVHNKDGIGSDGITYTLDVPEFKEMWVSQVYERGISHRKSN